MTPQQIRIVQSTWLKMLPRQFTTPQLFYRRLFEIDPSLRRLFRSDMRDQGQKLMQVVDTAVNGLSRMDHVVPMIQALGRRHAAYGVTDDHYGTVGAALLWTLGKSLGADFTPQVKDAWTSAYGMLATTMREAAREAKGEDPTLETPRVAGSMKLPSPPGRRVGESEARGPKAGGDARFLGTSRPRKLLASLRAGPKHATEDAKLATGSSHAVQGTRGHTGAILVVALLGLAAAAGLGFAAEADLGRDLTATIAQAHQPPYAASPRTMDMR